jgi:hypothetical protein
MATELWSLTGGLPEVGGGQRGDGDAGGSASAPAAAEAAGQRLARGVRRAFAQRGLASLTEFTLKGGRRADVIALDDAGEIAIVEVKSSRADFVGDGKWRAYLDFCDRFYFAVPPAFPRALLPADCGLIVADGYAAEILRDAPLQKLHAARRRAVTLRFARTASQRLTRRDDPAVLVPE